MTFSLELSDDVIEVRDWVHDFAEKVVRPAAAEWDEREETPWPIIQEAAKVGLYSVELFATQAAEPSGLGLLTVFEEMFWGDAGIALSILGTGLAAASLASTGTPEQLGEWLPQMFGTVDEPMLASFCASEPGAGSDVSAIITRARYDEASDEWIINGTKTWATNGGIANVHIVVASVHPELGSRGQATFIIPPATSGFSQGQKFKKHGIRASHTAEVVLDDVRIPAEVVVPHVVEDLALRQDATRVQHQEPKQLELGPGQLDRLVAAPHLACLLVEREVGEPHRAVGVTAGAPKHGLHAGNDLGKAERLGHVVVCEREPGDLVLGRILGGEEDHRHAVVPVAQPSRNREAVEVGQHHVEHDQVGAELVDCQLGGAAGSDFHGLEALVAEGGRDGVRDGRLVVDDEHLRGARGEDCDLCHGSKSASHFCEFPESFLCGCRDRRAGARERGPGGPPTAAALSG